VEVGTPAEKSAVWRPNIAPDLKVRERRTWKNRNFWYRTYPLNRPSVDSKGLQDGGPRWRWRTKCICKVIAHRPCNGQRSSLHFTKNWTWNIGGTPKRSESTNQSQPKLVIIIGFSTEREPVTATCLTHWWRPSADDAILHLHAMSQRLPCLK